MRNSWLIILGLTILGGVSFTVVALVATPIYRAEVLLSPMVGGSGGSALARLSGQLGPVANLFGDMDASSGLANKEVYIATLRSRRFTHEFIRANDLLPVLFPDKWNESENAWKVSDGESLQPSMDVATRLFDKEIRTISEDRRSGLVTLAIEWPDPVLAAQWAEDIVSRTNKFLQDRFIAEAERSMEFLEAELRSTDVLERQQIIYRQMEVKIGDVMMAKARNEYAFIVVDPAVVPDDDSYVWPNRKVMVAVGLMLGLLIGILVAGIRWAIGANKSGNFRTTSSTTADPAR